MPQNDTSVFAEAKESRFIVDKISIDFMISSTHAQRRPPVVGEESEMPFEKWEPQSEFERFPASATIVQSRLIRLPSPVASMLRLRGKSSANLYYDKKRKVIGIKPMEKKDEGAAKIRQSDKSTSLHVPSYFRAYDIDVPGL